MFPWKRMASRGRRLSFTNSFFYSTKCDVFVGVCWGVDFDNTLQPLTKEQHGAIKSSSDVLFGSNVLAASSLQGLGF